MKIKKTLLIVISLLLILPLINAAQFSYNFTTNTTNINNVCKTYGENFTITTTPCTADYVPGQVIKQDIDINYKGTSQQLTDWYFAYEGNLSKTNISVIEWVYNTRYNYTYGYTINSTIYSVNNFYNLTNSIWLLNQNNLCGNTSSTNNFVIVDNFDTYYCSGTSPNRLVNYKSNFSYYTKSGKNYNVRYNTYGVINQSPYLVYELNYTNINSKFQYVGSNLADTENMQYYAILNLPINGSNTKTIHWEYEPQNQASTGKWHILGKLNQDQFKYAIAQNKYIYQDPYWTINTVYKYYNTSNLMACYGFENDTTVDTMGKYNLTSTDTVNYTGKIGQSRFSNKTTSKLTGGELNMSSTQETFMGWVYRSSVGGAVNFDLMTGSFNGTSATGMEIMITKTSTPNGRVIYRYGTNDATFSSTLYAATNTWQHFAITRNGANITLYRNGAFVASITTSNSTGLYDFKSFYLFNRYDNVVPFNGSLDEWSIWNRSLGADEILANYNNNAGVSCSDLIKTVTMNNDTYLAGDIIDQGWVTDINSTTTTMNVVGRNLSSTNMSYLAANTVAYYSFDSTTNFSTDLTGTFTGTAFGNISNNSGGKYGNKIDLDGTGDWIRLSQNTRLSANANFNWTISAWYKTNGVTERYIYGRYNSSTSATFLDLGGLAGCLSFEVAAASTPRIIASYCNPEIYNNQWHHVVGVRSGNVIRIYFDGQLKNYSTHPNLNFVGTTNGEYSYIGAYANGASPASPFIGSIDELSIYNISMSDNEALTTYEQGLVKINQQYNYAQPTTSIYYSKVIPLSQNFTSMYPLLLATDLTNVRLNVSLDGGVNYLTLTNGTEVNWTQTKGDALIYSIQTLNNSINLTINYLNITFNNLTLNPTNITDSCIYIGSGDWTINLIDNCTLNTVTVLASNKIIFNGTVGSCIINTTISSKGLQMPTKGTGDSWWIGLLKGKTLGVTK